MPKLPFIQRVSDLYDQFQKHDAKQTDRLLRYRNIEPDSAQFLSMLIRIQHSKNILEIGTSTGHSTLWLAEAAQQTQGKVTTLEIEPARSQQAAMFAQELDVNQYVDFWIGDAADYLSESIEVFDLILLDAERSFYSGYWEDLKRLIKPHGGILIVDNVISHATEVKPFLEIIRHDSRFMSTTIALGAGLFMVVSQ